MAKLLRFAWCISSAAALVWPSQAPLDIPFERSKLFTEVDFTGRFATYGAADTWYPTWASDGKLYSPWTDGVVKGAKAVSACGGAKCISTTEHATIVGDDPLNLTIEDVGVVAASPSPYHGRQGADALKKRLWKEL